MIHIGFTGTQHGMTVLQMESLAEQLAHRDFWGHHGDCVGADKQFDTIARQCHHFRWMYIHPCNIEHKRAHVRQGDHDIVYSPQEPLTRNRDIVESCHRIFATPKSIYEERRSGTWATIRYARELRKPLTIIAPDGGLFWENHDRLHGP